jgi:hypothetical protein
MGDLLGQFFEWKCRVAHMVGATGRRAGAQPANTTPTKLLNTRLGSFVGYLLAGAA